MLLCAVRIFAKIFFRVAWHKKTSGKKKIMVVLKQSNSFKSNIEALQSYFFRGLEDIKIFSKGVRGSDKFEHPPSSPERWTCQSTKVQRVDFRHKTNHPAVSASIRFWWMRLFIVAGKKGVRCGKRPMMRRVSKARDPIHMPDPQTIK